MINNCLWQTCSSSHHKTLIDELEWCGLLVDYCDVFISCLDSHSDGTHSLQRIHWWASDCNDAFLQICSMKKKTHIQIGWTEIEYIFSKFSFLGELFLLVYTVNDKNHASSIFFVLNCYLNSISWEHLLCIILIFFSLLLNSKTRTPMETYENASTPTSSLNQTPRKPKNRNI